MKYLSRVLLIFVLLPFFSNAQSNYQPGYVVTLKDDTIRGFIDYQDWDSNPSGVSFKTAIADREKKNFTLNDINTFTIDGLATYKKYTCSISTDNTNTGHLNEGRDSSSTTRTVFLNVLQQGKNVALLSYTDELKTRFYIGDAPDFTPTELVYRLYYDPGNANGRTVYENDYQKQLFALANKYNALDDRTTARLQNSSYQKGDLLTIVSRINNISKADFEKKYSEHSKFSFYVSAGANISTTSSGSGSSYSTAGGVPSTSYLPTFAIGVNLIPNPVLGKEEFRIDLSFSPSKFNALYTLKVSPYVAARASYSQTDISATPQVIFNVYNKPDFKFYLGIGINVSYSSFSNVYFQSQASGTNQYFPIEPYYFNKLNNTFLLKAGVKINGRVEVYLNYFTSSATTAGGYFGLNDSIQQIGLSYFFGK